MRLIFALLLLSAVFAASTTSTTTSSTDDSGQLGSGARGPAFGSGVGITEDGRGVIGSGT